MAPVLSMRRVAQVASGPYCGAAGRVVCCDSDHDSLPELLFLTGTLTHSWDPIRIEVWEHQGWNRFSLVYADTGVLDEYPVGIPTGNVIPFASGDVDGDGLTDIVGVTAELDTVGPDSVFNVVVTIESPDSFSYPCSLSWYRRYADHCRRADPTYYPPDLDGDGHREILLRGGRIWENVNDDSNELAWSGTPSGGYCAFGDFDMDGRMDFATGGEVWENTGDNQYERVYRDTSNMPNGYDVFMTNDIDRDGRPEFYVAYAIYLQSKIWLYMYECESDGSHQFTRTLVDSVYYPPGRDGRASAGGDLDGDGIDECVWATFDSIRVYKAFGNNDLRCVWRWENDHGYPGLHSLTATVYDVNKDGYNELLVAGNAKTSIFQVAAVDLLSPNGGSCSVGDTVSIRWVTNTPPRCDSLSLFLRRDSLWNLSTIAVGLPGTDTLYHWVVPANVPDTGRIVVIAYGPGWQYDMSDSVITFIGGGVAEGTHNVPLQWALSISPNPARGAFSVRYDVPRQARVSVGIYDVDGRLAKSLSEGEISPGRYEAKLPAGELPAGIYFLRLDAPGFRSVKKAVVAR